MYYSIHRTFASLFLIYPSPNTQSHSIHIVFYSIYLLGTDEEATTTCRSGTRGFMAPEVESGGVAMFASDMYSFGVLLLFMHYPTIVTTLIPGSLALPPSCEAELSDLIQRLLSLMPNARPSAATALMHPYFRSTFVERLLQEGEVVEQDRKLEAVRDLLHRVRSENRTVLDKITVNREVLVETILDYFQTMPLEKMRSMLKITFVGEPGVDEGGLLTEMFTIFYDAVFSGHGGLFESASQAGMVVEIQRHDNVHLQHTTQYFMTHPITYTHILLLQHHSTILYGTSYNIQPYLIPYRWIERT